MTYRIRTATPDDLSAVVPLLNAAYGTRPTFGARFTTYLSLQAEGWVVAESTAGLVGVGGFVAFGRCAYIGLMAVSPDRQRGGIGAAVFEEILRRCEVAGCALLLLDASDQGAPLYERFSFQDHAPTRSYAIDPRARNTPAASAEIEIRPLDPGDAASLEEVAAFDARCYGADRSPLVRRCLREARERAFTAHDPSTGYLVGYSVGRQDSIGPCLARSGEIARALLGRTLSLPFGGKVTWLVAGQNRDATHLAEELGGAPTRTWRHMRRGDPAQLASDWSRLFGKISLAVG